MREEMFQKYLSLLKGVKKVECQGGALSSTFMIAPSRIWSKAYSPNPDTDHFTVQVDNTTWQRVMRQEGSRRKFVRIEHPEGLDDWICPLGQPVSLEEETETTHVYLPLWMLDSAHLQGGGEEAVTEFIDDEHFPEATRIVLRVIDSAFYNADVKSELEKALSAIGVIRQHTTLQIPVEALGGYTIEVFVSNTEPANLVLCDGEEVAVEFEEPVDQIAPPRPPTPIPQLPPILQTDGMIPDVFVPPQPTGFQAFQGQGHLVGSSNAHIPEWRRELGPPKRR